MKKKEENQRKEKLLRVQAEKRLGRNSNAANSLSDRDPGKFLHELNVHKIELEIQNEELHRLQAELEKSRAKYFDLYNLAPVGYFTLTEKGRILEANLTAVHLLGIEKCRFLEKPFSDFVTPEFQDEFYFHRRNVIKSGMQQACELKLLKKNGNSFFAHLESMPIRNVQNGINQIRTSIIDIHEKKQAMDAIKESAVQNELLLNSLPHPAMLIDKDRKILAANHLAKKNGAEIGGYWSSDFSRIKKPEFEGIFCLTDGEQNKQRLVTIVEDSNDAVTVLDLNGNIKAWNKRAEKIYGYSASEALKMTIFDLIPSRHKKETLNLLNDIKSGVLIQPFETRRLAKDGCLLDIRLTVTRLIQNEKIVAAATTERDITEYNRWLASIKELPQRIILAQEEERSRISQEIHSDFGQSLMALKMFVSMSASDLIKDNSQVTRVFEQVKDQLSRIIDKARDLSHELAPPSLKYIGLVEAIKKLIESAKYDKNLKIRFFHRNMSEMSFESKDIIIYRIVQEALHNIFKHAKATKARIKAMGLNSAFSLEITDNGKGFDPVKTRRSRGLGLDLMQEQAVLIHGALSIESQVGKGTTIKITVPIKERKKQ